MAPKDRKSVNPGGGKEGDKPLPLRTGDVEKMRKPTARMGKDAAASMESNRSTTNAGTGKKGGSKSQDSQRGAKAGDKKAGDKGTEKASARSV